MVRRMFLSPSTWVPKTTKNCEPSQKLYRAWYGWYGQPTWTRTEVDYYKTGVLILDIVDAATSKLIWRAYCSDTIRDMPNRDKNINSAVRKALDRFPPKQK